jgi:hypothetical protein
MHRYFILLLALAATAGATPELIGVLTSKEGSQFVVVPAPGATPRWIKIGDDVAGYVATGSRENDEVLILRKDGSDVAVRLKASSVQHADYRGQPMTNEAAKQPRAHPPPQCRPQAPIYLFS